MSNLFPMEGMSRKTRKLSRSDRVPEEWVFNNSTTFLILQTSSLIMHNYYLYAVIVVIWIVSLNFLSGTLASMTTLMDYLLFTLSLWSLSSVMMFCWVFSSSKHLVRLIISMPSFNLVLIPYCSIGEFFSQWLLSFLHIVLMGAHQLNNNREMVILCHNIRGINFDVKHSSIRNKIQEIGCDIICLQETKMENFDASYLKKFCPKAFDCSSFTPLVGASGGTITIWKGNKLQGEVVLKNEYAGMAKNLLEAERNSEMGDLW
jgi:hypothetical protein